MELNNEIDSFRCRNHLHHWLKSNSHRSSLVFVLERKTDIIIFIAKKTKKVNIRQRRLSSCGLEPLGHLQILSRHSFDQHSEEFRQLTFKLLSKFQSFNHHADDDDEEAK